MKINFLIQDAFAERMTRGEMAEVMNQFDALVSEKRSDKVVRISSWHDLIKANFVIQIETVEDYPSAKEAIKALYPDSPKILDFISE